MARLNNKSSSNMSKSFAASAWCEVDISTYGGGVYVGNIKIYQPYGTSFNRVSGYSYEVKVGGMSGGSIWTTGDISSPSAVTHGYGRNINCGAGTKSIEVVVSSSGISNYPCTFSGASVNVPSPVYKPTLSSLFHRRLTDKGVNLYFNVANNGGQNPDNWIDVFTGYPISDGNKVKANAAKDVTHSDLNGNRTYWARGNAGNSAGRTYTDVPSFKTYYRDVGPARNIQLTHTFKEPIPRAALTVTWSASSAGTDAVAGYRVILWKNGIPYHAIETNASTYSYTFDTFENLGFEVGDVVKVGILPFSKDWNNVKHYRGEFNAPEMLPSDYTHYTRYRVYRSSWENYVYNNTIVGVGGTDLKAVQINLEDQPLSGNIEYRSHMSGIGWQGYVSNGATSGTTGNMIEAIQMRLTGDIASSYDLFYRGYIRDINGWTLWRKNDDVLGYGGIGNRVDALQIAVVKKSDESIYGSTYSEEIIVVSDKYIKVSEDESDFEKYKLFVSTDEDDFKEVRKEYFHLLEEEDD